MNEPEVEANVQTAPSTTAQPCIGLKLILKRQHGDKYEIRNPNSASSNCSSGSSRPKREAARRVKFDFESDESPVKKKPKNCANPALKIPKLLLNFTETCIPFDRSELVQKSDALLDQISEHQVKICVNHSVPFPIALVEDKTNIVHTKALLMIHLYQSYSSPCIICVLCKQFFSIPAFSKHFHIGEDELDTESSGDELDQGSFHTFLSQLEQKKDKKLNKLRKKSYKILPYFLNQNNELNEHQLRTWRTFSGKFSAFKSARQKKSDEQKELEMDKEKRKRARMARPKSKRQPDPELSNWDFISDEKEDKYYFVHRQRLECEKIVCLEKSGRHLSDMDTDSDHDVSAVSKQAGPEQKQWSKSNEPDLSLSENEDDSGGDHDEETASKRPLKKSPLYFYDHAPTKLQRQFNYYENLAPNVFNYITKGAILLPSLSLVMFNLFSRFNERKEVLLVKTDESRLKWLSVVLDLELGAN
ncbi:hypothetical protein BpHYR1_044467 [Brachionus plicatilis]|uniref:c-SKI SMAD4-binding domain-containing protein n=1 Tax=Brachionus plicatilis TaxID=10195 RepID=A0A3M7P4L9_BRAPC|nr:hypothetical protein BpHYR1_044467 [Brachionus plicatilis]